MARLYVNYVLRAFQALNKYKCHAYQHARDISATTHVAKPAPYLVAHIRRTSHANPQLGSQDTSQRNLYLFHWPGNRSPCVKGGPCIRHTPRAACRSSWIRWCSGESSRKSVCLVYHGDPAARCTLQISQLQLTAI